MANWSTIERKYLTRREIQIRPTTEDLTSLPHQIEQLLYGETQFTSDSFLTFGDNLIALTAGRLRHIEKYLDRKSYIFDPITQGTIELHRISHVSSDKPKKEAFTVRISRGSVDEYIDFEQKCQLFGRQKIWGPDLTVYTPWSQGQYPVKRFTSFATAQHITLFQGKYVQHMSWDEVQQMCNRIYIAHRLSRTR